MTEIKIGQITLIIPTDASPLGLAVINGKFKKIFKQIEKFVEEYENKPKIVNGAYYCMKHDVKNCVVCFEQGLNP